jgi:hypothetical protein
VAYDTIVRLDSRIKHHFINAIAKELTEVAIQKVKSETTKLRRGGIGGELAQQQQQQLL